MFNIEGLTKEEFDSAMEAVTKVREENAKHERFIMARLIFDDSIKEIVDLIGVKETKAMLRRKIDILRSIE